MSAKSPREVDELFIKYMREGDMESVLSLYEKDVTFVDKDGETKRGQDVVREQLAHFANDKQVFKFDLKNIIVSDDIALVHNQWELISPEKGSGYAIEVMRRQPDGSWLFAIGDPFTLGPLVHAEKTM